MFDQPGFLRGPNADPLVRAIEVEHSIDDVVLELAITYRLTLLEQIRLELATLERARLRLADLLRV